MKMSPGVRALDIIDIIDRFYSKLWSFQYVKHKLDHNASTVPYLSDKLRKIIIVQPGKYHINYP